MVRDTGTLRVIGVTNPSEKGLSILTGRSGHTFRSIRAIACHQDIFSGIFLTGEDIAISLTTVLGL